MGRQVRYRNYPEEADALEAFIRSTGDVVFVPEEKTPNPEPVDVGTLRLDLLAPPPALWGLLLARRSDLPLLRHRQLPERGLWVLDKLSSPIVEYSPGYDRNGRIRRLPGRMWFPTSSYDKATGALVRPTDDFLAWADRLMRWVRRSWTLIDGDYHSPRAVDDYPSLRHPTSGGSFLKSPATATLQHVCVPGDRNMTHAAGSPTETSASQSLAPPSTAPEP
jgi:hypothetical protein